MSTYVHWGLWKCGVLLFAGCTYLSPLQVRWPIDRREADDPHAKAGLLLQAHLGRTPLPVSDYFTDTRTVLDNSLRILQVLTLQRPARLGLECRLLVAHPVSCASMGTGTSTHQFNLW